MEVSVNHERGYIPRFFPEVMDGLERAMQCVHLDRLRRVRYRSGGLGKNTLLLDRLHPSEREEFVVPTKDVFQGAERRVPQREIGNYCPDDRAERAVHRGTQIGFSCEALHLWKKKSLSNLHKTIEERFIRKDPR